jgi:ribosome biogenesis GTPase
VFAFTGKVIKKEVGRYWVKAPERTVVCAISAKLRKVLVYPEADPSSRQPTVDKVEAIAAVDPVAIGDEVGFVDAGANAGMITEVFPRRNKLSRKAAGFRPLEQVIAANIDQMVAVVAAAQPPPTWRLVDRYLADAEYLEIPALISFTKMDLVEEGTFREEADLYRRLGYPLLFNSSQTGTGLAELKAALQDKVSVLMGKSGVGKTSLLNAVQPALGLAVRSISAKTGKGRHTTSNLEMLELAFGGFVIDTPGMRELALWRADDLNVAWLFREMRPYFDDCTFGASCTHSHEPGCAVKAAVAAGAISERRYGSFLCLLEE